MSLRLALIGDLHLSERSPRFQHALDVLDFAIADAVDQGADVFALLGDLFEGHPTGAEYAALLSRVHRMRERGPVLAILGNHEAYAALAFWHHLGVIVAWDREAVLDLGTARILAIPYPRRGRAPFADLDGDDIAATMRSAADRVGTIIDEYRVPEKPLVVLGHFTIEGMTAGASEFEVHSATEVVVPRAAFDGCGLTAIGHIHRAQNTDGPERWSYCTNGGITHGEIVGVGSLIRHSFAEAADPKSYTLVTVDQGRVHWLRREVPAREQLVETMDWQASPSANAVAANLFAMQASGKEIKLTVEIAEDRLASFDPTVFDPIREAAVHFVLERVTVSAERVRAPQLMKASSLAEQFGAWESAMGLDLSPERRTRLMEKIAGLET